MVQCVCSNPSVDKYIWAENFREKENNRELIAMARKHQSGTEPASPLKPWGDTTILNCWEKGLSYTRICSPNSATYLALCQIKPNAFP